MQIEAGKFYKTRDGRKVGPILNESNAAWPFRFGSYYFKRDGYSCPGIIRNHSDKDDLIAEWSDFKIEAGKTYVTAAGDIVGPMERWDENVEHQWCVEGRLSRFHSGVDIWRADGTSFYGMPTLVAEHVRAPAASPISMPGDIVEVVADRYDAAPAGSLGRVTASCKEGRHVRMCDDGLSYTFALDEIALTDRRPDYEYKAGDEAEFGAALDDFDYAVALNDFDLRDDIAIVAMGAIIGKLPLRDTRDMTEGEAATIRKLVARGAYSYADAMLAARAA